MKNQFLHSLWVTTAKSSPSGLAEKPKKSSLGLAENAMTSPSGLAARPCSRNLVARTRRALPLQQCFTLKSLKSLPGRGDEGDEKKEEKKDAHVELAIP